MKKLFLLAFICLTQFSIVAQNPTPTKPRVLISTDIGGTDPDDNQSMTHLLIYSDLFQLEGLVSSPSYGNGNKEEILRMIDLYEKDLPKLKKHNKKLAQPKYLRSITKQGLKGNASFSGFTKATEGSDWIIKCAKKQSDQPLWVLGWGGLEDIAQALHDAPEIQNKIKIYWIGGPNKKWSANSYAYIVKNFPNLFFIEVNSSYYGFFSHNNEPDTVKTSDYFDTVIQGAGHLGKDFKSYYNGEIKMGDSPSLFYLMDGNPDNPSRESWGGSFEKITHSPRTIYHGTTTLKDTVAYCSIIEMHLKGPKKELPINTVCFTMEIPYGNNIQKWSGYYLGNGDYAIRYIPKKAENIHYQIRSEIAELNGLEGDIVVTNLWPGKQQKDSYILGNNWYSDKSDSSLFDGKIQGGKTILKWRNAILKDWAKRWSWLK